ncbi:MAG TPA: DUF4255 domain-containing protein [Chloroflexota bacterium]|nr:DUF4255 domain-containing protein [Chloroflexota bacterium]
MSNYLAIATVTATLSHLLQSAAGSDVPGATVTTTRPDGAAGDSPAPAINLYLYQVSHNPTWRNKDLPTRRADGRLAQRPRVALDLHYLLSFYGNEAQLEPQRLLGSAVRTLHARPILTRAMIQETMADANFAFLAPSDLDDEEELVRFSPVPLTLDELSKLWSVFFQTRYAVSVAYEASVVLIETAETPRPAPPVRRPQLYVLPFRQPVVDSVTSLAGPPDGPIFAGSALRISGRHLRADQVRVRIGGSELTPPAGSVRENEIELTLPPDALRAGLHGLQVVQPVLMGSPPAPHRGFQSNVASFVLRPTLSQVQVTGVQGTGSAPRSASVGLSVQPAVGSQQRVALLLNELTAGAPDRTPAAFSFLLPPRSADTATLTVPVSGLRPGQYLVRLQVDGAESVPEVDENPASPTFELVIGPRVVIP